MTVSTPKKTFNFERVHCYGCGKIYRAKFWKKRLQHGCPSCKSKIYGRRCKAEADKIVEDNQLLALKIVSRFTYRFSRDYVEMMGGFDEFVSEANIVLMYAARLYRDDAGTAFSTYAVTAIKRKLGQWLETQSLSCAAGIPIRDSNNYTVGYRQINSIHEIPHGQEEGEPYPIIAKDDGSQPVVNEDTERVREAMDAIDGRLRRILEQRYYQGLSLRQVGRNEGISTERVRQLVKYGVKKLAQKMEETI